MSDFVVEMKHISKSFLGRPILSDVSFQLSKGEIGLLIGKEGSGKTTLMSILLGFYQADSGNFFEFDREIEVNSAEDRRGYAVGIISETSHLADSLTVIENIVLGNEPIDFLGFIHYKKAIKEVNELETKYGLEVDLKKKVRKLSKDEKVKVEILKLLYFHKEIFIFDEPFRNLDESNKKEFVGLVKNLVKEGKSVVIISSEIDEAFTIADKVTVLRNGECVATRSIKDTTAKEVASLMEEPVKVEVVKEEPVEEVKQEEKTAEIEDAKEEPAKQEEVKPVETKQESEPVLTAPIEAEVIQPKPEPVKEEVPEKKEETPINKPEPSKKEEPKQAEKEIKRPTPKKEKKSIYSKAVYSSNSKLPEQRYFNAGLADTKGDKKVFIVSPLLSNGKISLNKTEQKPLKAEKETVKKVSKAATKPVKKTSKPVVKKAPEVEKTVLLPDGTRRKLTKEELYILRVNNLRPYWKKKKEK